MKTGDKETFVLKSEPTSRRSSIVSLRAEQATDAIPDHMNFLQSTNALVDAAQPVAESDQFTFPVLERPTSTEAAVRAVQLELTSVPATADNPSPTPALTLTLKEHFATQQRDADAKQVDAVHATIAASGQLDIDVVTRTSPKKVSKTQSQADLTIAKQPGQRPDSAH
jgi:hypothetical protein